MAVTVSDSNGSVIGKSSVILAPYSKTQSTLRTLPGLTGMVGKVGSAQFTVSTAVWLFWAYGLVLRRLHQFEPRSNRSSIALTEIGVKNIDHES